MPREARRRYTGGELRRLRSTNAVRHLVDGHVAARVEIADSGREASAEGHNVVNDVGAAVSQASS